MEPLKQRVRPTRAEIDLRALASNARVVRRLLDQGSSSARKIGASMMAVVKADAYGHGAIRVARQLESMGQELGLAYFGVALVEEGLALREAGIQTPILVLSGAFDAQSAHLLVDYALTPVVFRGDQLEWLAAAVETCTRAPEFFPVHLKVDTGMGRIGVLPEEVDAFLEQLKALPRLKLEGLMSHFANADIGDEAETTAQLTRFELVRLQLEASGQGPTWAHLFNSAAVLSLAGFPPEQNLVRPGLMLYGASPIDEAAASLGLTPVMRWVSAISHLKQVPPGFKVSYGQTWSAARLSKIATLPIGYADGYNRKLSNGAPVLIGGKRCPVIGRVCMDLMMVDVTDLPAPAIGDEVVLIGSQGDETLGVSELAQRAGTIGYEILCCVGSRVPRVIVGE